MKTFWVKGLILVLLPGAVATPAHAQKAPPGFVPSDPSAKPPARLRDLNLVLPKGWAAKYWEGSVQWTVEKNVPPNYPTVYVAAILSTRERKDFADFLEKLRTQNDPFGHGYRWTGVTEKGKWADGYYAVGPVKLSTDKEARDTGIAILRKMGGQQILFASFKMNDAAERKELMQWARKATFGAGGKAPAGKGEAPKRGFDPAAVRGLKATLPAGWKDDGTTLNVRRFYRDTTPKRWVFATLYNGKAPGSAPELAGLARKDPDLFPHREWVKTKGIGKLPDGCFLVGVGKAGGFENDAIGAVRTIEGKTVLFLCVSASEAADRKEMLRIVRSAKFGP